MALPGVISRETVQPTCPPLHDLLRTLSHPGSWHRQVQCSHARNVAFPAALPPCTAGSCWPGQPALSRTEVPAGQGCRLPALARPSHLLFCVCLGRGVQKQYTTAQQQVRSRPGAGRWPQVWDFGCTATRRPRPPQLTPSDPEFGGRAQTGKATPGGLNARPEPGGTGAVLTKGCVGT